MRTALAVLPPRMRLALVVGVVLVAAVAAGYFLWLRDSSLVAIERTAVTGTTSRDADEIRAELRAAAEGMTTLNHDDEVLERAVASYPAVAGVETSVDLPHGLEVEVIERRPVATVERPDGEPVPVAADGTLLPSFRADHSLPPLPGEAPGGAKVTDEDTVATLAAVVGAPPELARRIEAVEPGEGRLTALIADGPAVVLGDASRVEEKWTAVAAVLAQTDGASAAYIDVRHPERPAVGG